MDEQDLYDVVLTGTLMNGSNVEATAVKVAALFKVSANRAAGMLQGHPLAVKRAVDFATATKYKVAIERAGARCRLAPVIPEPPLEFDFSGKETVGERGMSLRKRPSAPNIAQSLMTEADTGSSLQDNDLDSATARKAEEHSTKDSPAFWNPLALSNWSFFLTPIFGSYLVSQNYRAMGNDNDAKRSMDWFYISIAVLICAPLLMKLFGRSGLLIGMFLYITNFLVWHFRSARKQNSAIASQFGKQYERQPWGKTLAIGVAANVVWQLVVVPRLI